MGKSVLAHDLKTTQKIIFHHLRPRDAKVYLFGSHATGKAKPHSDIDVAVLPLRPIDPMILTQIKDELEESDIVRNVDIVDLSKTDRKFRQRVEREGVVWIG